MNTTESTPLPKLALIAGPTASGKSAVAMALAKLMPITIINADASQLYKDLQIISARPSQNDELLVPHALFGTVDGSAACSAADWAALAKAAIVTSHKNGRLPVLVGGTGLYIRTLLEGIAPVPVIDPDIRCIVRALPVSMSYEALLTEDPNRAVQLSAGDSARIARSLEVIRSTGKSILSWQADLSGGIGDQYELYPIILLPPRDWLFARCDARFETMLAQGAADEVRVLLDRGLDPSLPVMRAIGVHEIAAMISDPSCQADARAAAQQATRNFAKRQYTWFRNQSPAHWPRHEQQLTSDEIDNLVIKLRDMTLTS
jgi:tRNA dimethylallyltransferase